MPAFKGLPKDFFVFFKELAKNNERAWFEANKQRYKDVVVSPLCDFMEAMAPRVGKISKHIIVDPRPNGGSMFRIYRDVRFGKDKRPYKEHAAIHFRHALGRDVHVPAYYMHFGADEVYFGGGVWMPEADALSTIRHAIADDPKGWKKLRDDKAFVKEFKTLDGETLSRPPKGFDPDHPLIEDLKRKSFFATHESSPKSAQSAALIDEMTETMRAAKPLMKFLCDALDAPF